NQKQITDNKNSQNVINTKHENLIGANTTATSNEVSRAKTAEEVNQKQITDNKNSQNVINTKHENLIGANTTATSNEVSRAKTAEEVNQKQITDNKNSQNVINTKHENLIGANTTATSNEVIRAKDAESINAKKIAATSSQVNNIGTLTVDKNGNPTPLIGKSSDQFDLTGSSGQLKALASAHNKNAQEIGDLKNLEHDQIRSIYADPVTAPASPTPGSSSTVSSVPHANSNGEILQRGGQDLTVVKAFNTLDSDILINHEDIIKLNDKTVKNTGEISDNKNNIAQNKSDINKLQSHSNSSAKHIQNNDKRITKNTQDIHHNTERINSVEAQMKKGIADAVAVAEIKYPKMEKGEMGIGAGYGTYESENAIAIGVGLQATDNLFINASVGATSGADDSVVGGAGVSYKFKVF
ncbi:YadA C-terminal domain-containing protein, partial [Psychrilyobacter atlanticus]|uniref:YadA C-terminal domain-containing protein n=1 Tax=Psychrilyobacter atlanticus TaxID=271091 RepID=UPI00055EBE0D